ncbi:hypothetical protein PVK06_027924 [Gossypium arboreum]|uniref:Uncharacterized protein n=1 Tax=Gossypium arboreum TaxID=29729 RepID=A0ABR0P1V9_GOSAR|nr:hypothetical protein PVK06_027924 [Gossypium arboreum]
MILYRSLPPKPSIEDVAATKSILKIVENEEKITLEEISIERPPEDVLDAAEGIGHGGVGAVET